MKPSELLRRAKALIVDKSRWWDGGTWHTHSQICSLQAFHTAFHAEDGPDLACSAGLHLMNAVGESGGTTIPQFNDTHSHAEVMAMWDRAIELAEAAEMYAELGQPVEEAVTV